TFHLKACAPPQARLALAAALAFVLAGCSLAPRYERPAAPVPASYTSVDGDTRQAVETAASAPADAALLDDWRAYFTDPGLQAWIDAALANNRDLRIAAGRLDEARALYGVQRADLMPSVDANLGYERTRQYDPVVRESAVSGLYRAGVGISAYELDLFGRVRNLSDAALAEYFATADAQRTVRIGVIAEVAGAYVSERSLREQLALAQRTLDARERIAALTQRRYAAGTSDAIELRSAEMLVASARASQAALQREHAQSVRALQLLAGDFARTVPSAGTVRS
ncbi:TolC family protein, partial [Burkholderia territorii]|uniref:TolC family protein n=1 Tax=Burkholderia territorii TaxID=1503055 RepID=UPI003D1600B1